MTKKIFMRKYFFIIVICVVLISTIMVLCGCNGTEPTYYGTYHSGTNSARETITFNKDGMYVGTEQDYYTHKTDYTYNNGVLHNSVVGSLYLYEDDEVIVGDLNSAQGTTDQFYVRNGFFNNTIRFMQNYTITNFIEFNDDGTYIICKIEPLTKVTGTYTLNNGVLIFTVQTKYGPGVIHDIGDKMYAYIDSDFNFYTIAYIKHPELFEGNGIDTQEPEPEPNPGIYYLNYLADEGGNVEGETFQTIYENGSGLPVTAIADEGFTFTGWSDGMLTAERTDENITANLTVIAQFEKIPEYTLTYEAQEGGYLEGETTQTVQQKESGTTVKAVAQEGYTFIGWSDGMLTAERTDENITANLTVIAQFEKIPEYTLTYEAQEGGYLEGETTQIVQQKESGTTVKAVAKEGYIFIGWSDGVLTAERTEQNVTENISVTAMFESDTVPKFAGGCGTTDDPYLIETECHLKNISYDPLAHYQLIDDIVLNEVEGKNSNFIPLFTDEIMFNGTLDGNGFSIKNLTIYNDRTYYTGLFACIGESGVVKNLTLDNVNLTGKNYIGGIAGYAIGSITDCVVVGKITLLSQNSFKKFLGGIAGRAENNVNGCRTQVLITSQEAEGEMYVGGIVGYYDYDTETLSDKFMISAEVSININAKDTSYAGGLIGEAEKSLHLEDCYVTGSILSTSYSSYAGGLVGRIMKGGAMLNCYSTVDIVSSGGSSYTGGLAGYFYGSIVNCYATGEITTSSSSSYIGGLIGDYNGGSMVNCYATSNITASGWQSCIGGLFGHFSNSGSIVNCYSTGDVIFTGESSQGVGGLAGYFYGGSIVNCYVTGEVIASTSYVGGLIGNTGSAEINNTHWLYFPESSVQYAVGYNDNLGIPTSIGATKHTDIKEFYILADVLNQGQENPVWEHKTENSLPTLIKIYNS